MISASIGYIFSVVSYISKHLLSPFQSCLGISDLSILKQIGKFHSHNHISWIKHLGVLRNTVHFSVRKKSSRSITRADENSYCLCYERRCKAKINLKCFRFSSYPMICFGCRLESSLQLYANMGLRQTRDTSCGSKEGIKNLLKLAVTKTASLLESFSLIWCTVKCNHN